MLKMVLCAAAVAFAVTPALAEDDDAASAEEIASPRPSPKSAANPVPKGSKKNAPTCMKSTTRNARSVSMTSS